MSERLARVVLGLGLLLFVLGVIDCKFNLFAMLVGLMVRF